MSQLVDRAAYERCRFDERHSNVSRRQPQNGGQGARGHYQPSHHNMSLPAFDGLAGVQGEPVAAFPDLLDIAKPTNENVLNLMRVYQPQRLFQIDLHYDALPTRARREVQSPACDSAIAFAGFLTDQSAHAYRKVNA